MNFQLTCLVLVLRIRLELSPGREDILNQSYLKINQSNVRTFTGNFLWGEGGCYLGTLFALPLFAIACSKKSWLNLYDANYLDFRANGPRNVNKKILIFRWLLWWMEVKPLVLFQLNNLAYELPENYNSWSFDFWAREFKLVCKSPELRKIHCFWG